MNAVPKILHIVHSLKVGGLERIVVELAKGFAKKGYFVGICCLDVKEPLGLEAEKAGVKVFSLNKKPGIAWNLPLKIAHIIKTEHINLVHTHNEAGLLYGGIGGLLAGTKKIIHTEHGKELGYDKKNMIRIVERYLLRHVNGIAAVSNDIKTKIINWHGFNSVKIFTIPNGINIESFDRREYREAKRRELGLESEYFVIGNVASLLPLKNHHFLFNIFGELLKKFPKIKLVLVGDGPLRWDLESLSVKKRISSNVIFLGTRKDVAELLTVFDMFILTSFTEGLSVSLLEAMASSIPVVASDVGGNSEIIKHGKNGFLIPLEAEKEWATTIKMIIENMDLRKSIGEMAKYTVTERFSLTQMVDQYEKLYSI